VTGSLFFVPTTTFLDNVDATAPSPTAPAPPIAIEEPEAADDESTGSLNIGSLKGEKNE
jgi:porphyrinogen peroxidase